MITINYVKHLDKVVIRPSRIDRKIEFRLVDKDIIIQLFYVIFILDSDSSNLERQIKEKKT